MATLEALDRRLRATQALRGVAKTMKTLSAVKIAEFERAARAADQLEEVAVVALQGLLATLERPYGRAATEPADGLVEGSAVGPEIAVVVGSDHGLCGGFNEDLARFALERLGAGRQDDGRLARTHALVIGARAQPLLERRGFTGLELLEQAGAASGVARLADLCFERIDAVERAAGPARVTVFHNRRERGGARRPHETRLAPLDPRWLAALSRRPWPGPTPPLPQTPPQALFPRVVRNLLYARMNHALAHSLAAEHAARLSTMQAAEHAIDERLSELEDGFRSLRQEQITLEIAELHATLAAAEG